MTRFGQKYYKPAYNYTIHQSGSNFLAVDDEGHLYDYNTDLLALMQALIDSKTTGVSIKLMDLTGDFNDELDITANMLIKIVGEGIGRTVFNWAGGTGKSIIKGNSGAHQLSHRIILEDFSITCNDGTYTNLIAFDMNNVNRFSMKRVNALLPAGYERPSGSAGFKAAYSGGNSGYLESCEIGRFYTNYHIECDHLTLMRCQAMYGYYDFLLNYYYNLVVLNNCHSLDPIDSGFNISAGFFGAAVLILPYSEGTPIADYRGGVADGEVALIQPRASRATAVFAGSMTNIKVLGKKAGLLTENKGTSTGTGAQQTIPHGLAGTPTVVLFGNIEDGANPYQSASANATNIYITAVSGKDYAWYAYI